MTQRGEVAVLDPELQREEPVRPGQVERPPEMPIDRRQHHRGDAERQGQRQHRDHRERAAAGQRSKREAEVTWRRHPIDYADTVLTAARWRPETLRPEGSPCRGGPSSRAPPLDRVAVDLAARRRRVRRPRPGPTLGRCVSPTSRLCATREDPAGAFSSRTRSPARRRAPVGVGRSSADAGGDVENRCRRTANMDRHADLTDLSGGAPPCRIGRN